MDDKKHLSNKICGQSEDTAKNTNSIKPVKRLYFLENQHFIIIDKSIAKKLNFFDPENKELYFQEEVTEDDCILLRPFKIGE